MYPTNPLLLEEAEMKKFFPIFTLMIIVSIGLTACGGGTADNLLDDINNRGYVAVSTDPNYEPQSFLDPDAARVEGTVCPDDMLTYGEMKGFDVDVAQEIANRLGVEVCYATPDWDVVTAGNWGDRWDLSVGSMTVTTGRQEVLNFATPYYFSPAQFAAAADSGITTWEDLEGQTICMAAATTYLDWINGVDMGLPEESLYTDPPSDFTIVELPTDQECAQSIAAGRPEFQVYLTSNTVVDSNIAGGLDVVKVGGAVFAEGMAPAIDKSHSLDSTSFVAAVDDAVNAMRADGTLSDISKKWFDGVDLTEDPSQ
jgi:polar amino acid transport system substrate-binding protein